MSLQQTQTPYELLARWNEDGTLSGAHVKFLTKIMDGDKVIHVAEGEATPVDLDGTGGFPLDDILQEAHTAALATANLKGAEAEASKAAHAEAHEARTAAETELEKVTGQRETALAELKSTTEALEANRAALAPVIAERDAAHRALHDQVSALNARLGAALVGVETITADRDAAVQAKADVSAELETVTVARNAAQAEVRALHEKLAGPAAEKTSRRALEN